MSWTPGSARAVPRVHRASAGVVEAAAAAVAPGTGGPVELDHVGEAVAPEIDEVVVEVGEGGGEGIRGRYGQKSCRWCGVELGMERIPVAGGFPRHRPPDLDLAEERDAIEGRPR